MPIIQSITYCFMCQHMSFVAQARQPHTNRVTVIFLRMQTELWSSGGAVLLLAFLHPTESEPHCCSVLPVLLCVCVNVCVFLGSCFDLQSFDCYSCGGDLDAESKRDCTSLSPMCETNTHCDVPLLYVCARKHHHSFIPAYKHSYKVPLFFVSREI